MHLQGPHGPNDPLHHQQPHASAQLLVQPLCAALRGRGPAVGRSPAEGPGAEAHLELHWNYGWLVVHPSAKMMEFVYGKDGWSMIILYMKWKIKSMFENHQPDGGPFLWGFHPGHGWPFEYWTLWWLGGSPILRNHHDEGFQKCGGLQNHPFQWVFGEPMMDGNPHVYGVCSTMFVLMFFVYFFNVRAWNMVCEHGHVWRYHRHGWCEKWLKTSLKRYAKIPYSCLRLIKDLRQMSCDRMSNFQGKAYQLQLSLPHGPECHGMHLIYCLINIVYTASSRGLHRTGISLQIVAVTWVSLSYQAYKVGQTGQETTGPASCLQVVCEPLKEQKCHRALQLWLAESIWANAELIPRPNSKVQQTNHNNHQASSCNTATGGTCNTSRIPHVINSTQALTRTQSSRLHGRNTIDQGSSSNPSDFGSIAGAVLANHANLGAPHYPRDVNASDFGSIAGAVLANHANLGAPHYPRAVNASDFGSIAGAVLANHANLGAPHYPRAVNASDFGSIAGAVLANHANLGACHRGIVERILLVTEIQKRHGGRGTSKSSPQWFCLGPWARWCYAIQRLKCASNLHNAPVILHVASQESIVKNIGQHVRVPTHTHTIDGHTLGWWCSSRTIFFLNYAMVFLWDSTSHLFIQPVWVSPLAQPSRKVDKGVVMVSPKLMTGSCCIIVLLPRDKMILNHVEMGIILWELEFFNVGMKHRG